MADSPNVFPLKEIKVVPDAVQEYTEDLKTNDIPLIIDNGSYNCRVGWAIDDKPRLVFKNMLAKQRGKKESETQIGNDITNYDAKLQIKTPFDKNIVTLYDVQERIFDHIFLKFGIDTEGRVNHPIVLTEATCNPLYCRQQMSELLFECYRVPQVAYGVDALFSMYNNTDILEDASGLVLSFGYHTTHVMPYINGKFEARKCRRINVGGCLMESYMQRLLQLKYPAHTTALSIPRIEEFIRSHSYVAPNYFDELDKWATLDYYEDNVHKIQLPFSNLPGYKTSSEQMNQRRQEQIKKMKELDQRRRQEKLALMESELQRLLCIEGLVEDEDEEPFRRAMGGLGLKTVSSLQEIIKKLSICIQRFKYRIAGIELAFEPEQRDPPAFDLVEVPDDQLNQDQRDVKKKQRSLKCAFDGRVTAKKLRLVAKKKEMEVKKQLEKLKKEDTKKWIAEVREKRQHLVDRASKRKMRRSKGSGRGNRGLNESWNLHLDVIHRDLESDSEAEIDLVENYEETLRDNDPEFDKEGDQQFAFDIAEYYRVHLAVERIRIPELLFQPSMLAIEQAGVMEAVDFVLQRYSPEEQQKLVNNVFVTGSNACLPGFQQRIENELRMIRPFESQFKVNMAENPVLDAWNGARKFSLSPNFSSFSITRGDYLEKGGEYLKEHFASNKYAPPHIPVPGARRPSAHPLVTSPAKVPAVTVTS